MNAARERRRELIARMRMWWNHIEEQTPPDVLFREEHEDRRLLFEEIDDLAKTEADLRDYIERMKNEYDVMRGRKEELEAALLPFARLHTRYQAYFADNRPVFGIDNGDSHNIITAGDLRRACVLLGLPRYHLE